MPNSYTELGTLRTSGEEEESPTTVYECGDCGGTVSDIINHEKWHAMMNAAINLLIRNSERERDRHAKAIK